MITARLLREYERNLRRPQKARPIKGETQWIRTADRCDMRPGWQKIIALKNLEYLL